MLRWIRALHTFSVMEEEEEKRQTSVVVKVTERPGLMTPLSCEKLFTFYRVHSLVPCFMQNTKIFTKNFNSSRLCADDDEKQKALQKVAKNEVLL